MAISDYVSADYLFTAGLGFDVAGAILLGRGVVGTPRRLALRTASYWDYNPHAGVAAIESSIDAELGVRSLIIGFALQAGGYAATIGGATVTSSSWWVPVIAGVLAVASWRATMAYARRFDRRMKKLNLARDLACVDPRDGYVHAHPNGDLLVSLGEAMDMPRYEGQSVEDYLREHFDARPRTPEENDQRS